MVTGNNSVQQCAVQLAGSLSVWSKPWRKCRVTSVHSHEQACPTPPPALLILLASTPAGAGNFFLNALHSPHILESHQGLPLTMLCTLPTARSSHDTATPQQNIDVCYIRSLNIDEQKCKSSASSNNKEIETCVHMVCIAEWTTQSADSFAGLQVIGLILQHCFFSMDSIWTCQRW